MLASLRKAIRVFRDCPDIYISVGIVDLLCSKYGHRSRYGLKAVSTLWDATFPNGTRCELPPDWVVERWSGAFTRRIKVPWNCQWIQLPMAVARQAAAGGFTELYWDLSDQVSFLSCGFFPNYSFSYVTAIFRCLEITTW